MKITLNEYGRLMSEAADKLRVLQDHNKTLLAACEAALPVLLASCPDEHGGASLCDCEAAKRYRQTEAAIKAAKE